MIMRKEGTHYFSLTPSNSIQSEKVKYKAASKPEASPRLKRNHDRSEEKIQKMRLYSELESEREMREGIDSTPERLPSSYSLCSENRRMIDASRYKYTVAYSLT